MKSGFKPFVLLVEVSDADEALAIRMKLESFGVPNSDSEDCAGGVFESGGHYRLGFRVFIPGDRLDLAREVIRPGLIDPAEPEEEGEEKKE